MPSCTLDHVPQIADSGLVGKKPYTGNYPRLILDALRRPFGKGGLSLEALGQCLGCYYDDKWHDDLEPEVRDSVRHLEDLGLIQESGKLWTLKKVRT